MQFGPVFLRHDGSLASGAAVAKVPEQTVRWVDLEGHLAGISSGFLVLDLFCRNPAPRAVRKVT